MIVLVLLGCPKPAQPVGPPEPTEAVAEIELFSDAELVAWAEELVPLVEKHGGARFREPPPVEAFTVEELRSFAGRESKLIMDMLYRDTPEAVRQAHAEAEAGVSLRGLFGKYGIFTGKVYVVRESLVKVADEQGPEVARNVGRLVLAHELGHALQAAQEDDPAGRIGELMDQDHFHGWSAVSEGGANLIAKGVAEELGLTEAFWTLSRMQGWDQEGLQDPGAYDIWMRYGRGLAMLEEVVRDGGMDAFWAWHHAPPASSSMIFRPDTYSPTPPTRDLDYAAVLRGTDQALTRGAWLAANSRLGEYVLRGEAIRTGKEDELEAVLAHLVDAQRLELTLPDRAGDIRYLRFDGAEVAREYLALLRAEQTVEGQRLARQLGVTVEVTYAPVNDVEGDASLLRTQRIPTGGGSFVESRTAWVARGPDVVQVAAERFRPGLRLANTIEAVFSQLEAVRAPQP
ncbi:MAG: hypothetical protein KC656_14710 [Myxococcales bacterium]|nr:hypothetical protein [Myxococcales bacterium]MCB9691983.1 hypothetical protein [Alphaproteobacteria bacterium]